MIKTIFAMFSTADVYSQFSKVHCTLLSGLTYQINSKEDIYLSVSFANQSTHVTIQWRHCGDSRYLYMLVSKPLVIPIYNEQPVSKWYLYEEWAHVGLEEYFDVKLLLDKKNLSNIG